MSLQWSYVLLRFVIDVAEVVATSESNSPTFGLREERLLVTCIITFVKALISSSVNSGIGNSGE